MKVRVKVLVAQSCLTLCDPMDCSPPGFTVHGILQARVLEWVAISEVYIICVVLMIFKQLKNVVRINEDTRLLNL